MKRALVTGGSGEIGATICRALATQGLHVLVHANSRLDRAAQVVARILQEGGSADSLRFDVTSTEDTRQVLDRIL